MGKELKNIDELYRSELGGSVTQAPDFVKKNIDNALGFKKRKTGYLLLGLIALLTTVGITAAVLTNMDDADQVAQSNMDASDLDETVDNSYALNNAVTELPSTNESSNTNQNATDELNDVESTSTNEHATINTNSANSNASSYAVNNSVNQTGGNQPTNRNSFPNYSSGNTNSNTNGIVDFTTTQPDPANTNTVSQNPNQQSDNTTDQQNDNTTGNTQLVDNNTSSSGGNPTQPDLTDNVDTNSNGGNVDIESNSLAVKTSTPDNTIGDNGSNTDSDSNANQASSDPNTDKTNTTIAETNVVDNDSTTTDDNLVTDDADDANDTNEPPTVIEPPVEDDYKPFMLSLTSGVNILRSNYTSESMNEETLYENALNDRIGNQTNLDITYRLKNGLTFGSGLGLNNYTESYEFTTYETYFDTTEVFETIIYDTSDYPVDTVYTYAYDVLQKGTQVSGKNKASYFTLPVHIGTQMRFNKFQLDLYATARFNFLMRSSGGYYNNNEVVSFGKENSIYKPFYVDVLFASKVHYNLLNNLYLTGTVQYRPVMGNSFKEVSFNKTFDYMHFGLGLSLRL